MTRRTTKDWPDVWQEIRQTARLLGRDIPEGLTSWRADGEDLHLAVPDDAREYIERNMDVFKPILWPFVLSRGCIRLIYEKTL